MSAMLLQDNSSKLVLTIGLACLTYRDKRMLMSNAEDNI
jgi:hypothetical protein